MEPDRALHSRVVEITPPSAVSRRAVTWDGVAVEVVEATAAAAVKFRFHGASHLLIVREGTDGDVGQAVVRALLAARMREPNGALNLIMAGHDYQERCALDAGSRTIFVYLDPEQVPDLDPSLSKPMLENALVLTLALGLKHVVESSLSSDEAGCPDGVPAGIAFRGGLASWQKRAVAEHIERHLARNIPIAELAGLARLSPYHFARAFKQSFGAPPHQYHLMRRVERAKAELAESATPVTEIGLALGFADTSAFTATFHKIAGSTPTAWRRAKGREEAMTPAGMRKTCSQDRGMPREP